MNNDTKYTYSEIFYSIQGEGTYTGVPTVWLRFFLCNLQCNGFGQADPTDKSTYILPYKDFDTSTIKKVEDLPVWKYGCDSSYSWAKKFKHLQHNKTAAEIYDAIQDSMKTESNPKGTFFHPNSRTHQHMCFTGGEPLMKHGQEAFIAIMKEFIVRDNLPYNVTFETNGTQTLTPEFVKFCNSKDMLFTEIFFSVSPKLFTVSGESPDKAIKPEVVHGYEQLINYNGQLKPVVGSDERQWEELERVVQQFRDVNVVWPVWVMPLSATVEDQLATAGAIAEKAFKRGYNVSARVHCYLFGNQIGT